MSQLDLFSLGEEEKIRTCLRCGVDLTPGGNWSNSRIKRRDYVCSKCRNRGINRGIYTPSERRELIERGELVPRPCACSARNGMLELGGVYFITYDDGVEEWVKIGESSRFLDRFKGFATSSPHNIKVLYLEVCEDRQMVERCYHARFSQLRGRGEWFRLDQEVQDLIASKQFEPFLAFED
jgi:hypothetical protein